MKFIIPALLIRQLSTALLTVCSAITAHSSTLQVHTPAGPSEDAMRVFLKQGKWTVKADDNQDFTGETLQAQFIKSLVEEYQANPTDPTAIANLSLVALALAVAEWGVTPSLTLPPDPVKKNWAPAAGAGDGKHLMSYSKGGIGVMHQDSGRLARLVEYLEKNHPDIVPAEHKQGFFRLKGINFDKLYAAGGHCTKPTSEIRTDLSGSAFQHTQNGYAGDRYCHDHNKPELKLTPKDWQVFRHGMREALRYEDVQFKVIRDFATNEWASAYDLAVVKGGHDVREAFILARIWNSAPKLAKCAFDKSEGISDTSARIQKELEAYAEGCANSKARMKERWPYMQRAIIVYDAFAKK